MHILRECISKKCSPCTHEKREYAYKKCLIIFCARTTTTNAHFFFSSNEAKKAKKKEFKCFAKAEHKGFIRGVGKMHIKVEEKEEKTKATREKSRHVFSFSSINFVRFFVAFIIKLHFRSTEKCLTASKCLTG